MQLDWAVISSVFTVLCVLFQILQSLVLIPIKVKSVEDRLTKLELEAARDHDLAIETRTKLNSISDRIDEIREGMAATAGARDLAGALAKSLRSSKHTETTP